jgi:hypothetical protein
VLTAEREDLARIRDTTGAMDSIMQQVAGQAVNEVGHRHGFIEPIAEGEGVALYGDAVNSDFSRMVLVVYSSSLWSKTKLECSTVIGSTSRNSFVRGSVSNG